MRQVLPSHLALGFAVVAALATPLVIGLIGASASVGCGPDQTEVWFCLNPVTGKLQDAPYDPTHYVDGTFDPCHCYDPCGPAKSCPDVIDAGPPPPDCDAGANDAAPGTGGAGGGG